MGEIEKLQAALARKVKADALPETVRAAYVAEYEAVRKEIAEAAVALVDWVYRTAGKVQQAADLVAETLAEQDYGHLIERAKAFLSDFEQEINALETADWTPWGKTVDSRDGGRA